MPEGLTITTEEVIKAAERIKAKRNKIDTIFEAFKTDMKAAGVAWESSGAAITYQEQFRSLSAKFPDFIDTLDQYEKFLLNVAQIYEEVDRKASKRAEELQSDYNG